ncbi:cupin domain-containing protein [Anaerorhabdus sp.]|uniref:cupin domain-containing protein n=1 Tax=Anaerorhabdus sp. TaxID=1872524 RepID=UPI002FC742B7
MIIDFNTINEVKIPGMNNGTGEMSAQMYMDPNRKIIPTRIHKGGSIGLHTHQTSDDLNYIISGIGKAICDDKEEILYAGTCHLCPKGSSHSIINTGDDDLVLLTIVIER